VHAAPQAPAPAAVQVIPAAAAELPRPSVSNRPTAPAAPAPEKKGHLITSPFVGTFYRNPSPDQPPYAEVGSVVRKGQTLCIIEAMKLMNEIESEVAGKVAEILVENAQPVEFGQALFRIEPA
jgi:acetyl-CoA carboxylase biotin carboxyl carrier protein